MPVIQNSINSNANGGASLLPRSIRDALTMKASSTPRIVPYEGVSVVRRPFFSKGFVTCLILMILIVVGMLPYLLSPEEEELLWQEANVTLLEIEQDFQVDPVVAAASLRSTATLISAIVLGILASKYGVLDHAAIDALARLAYNIFEPCLMLCAVSKTLSEPVGGLTHRSLFVLMPLASLFHSLLGYISGRAMISCAPTRSPSDARDLLFCCTFANSVNLPMVFAASLFASNQKMASDAISCISFYVLLICPIFYTAGVGFLQTPEEKSSTGQDPNLPKEHPIITGIKQSLNPPVLGAAIGVVLGTVGPLKHIFLKKGIGAPFYGALQTFGQAYLPSSILVLAGSMAATADEGADKDDDDMSAESSQHRKKTMSPLKRSGSQHYDDAGKPIDGMLVHPSVSASNVMWIMISRFVVWPVGTNVMISILSNTSLLMTETPRNRAILSFVILVQGSMPPAQNSVLLLQLAGMRERAARMTKLLTIVYCISILPVTILVSHALERTRIMHYAVKTQS